MKNKTHNIFTFKLSKWIFLGFICLCSCAEEEEELIKKSTETPRYLYVSSGACYSGNGITTFTNLTSSNQFYRLNLASGQKDTFIADFFSSPSSPGDSPISIAEYDSNRFAVLIENTTTATLRRIELIDKKQFGGRVTYSNNTTALSAQVRKMRKLSDGYMLISKSTAVEKITAGSGRLTIGANPWISLATPTSACTTSTTLISSILQLPSGLLAFAHAGTGNARIGIVSALGYSIAGDCKAGQTAPNANAFPTSMVYDKKNQYLIVSYGGSSTGADLNSIYAYSIDETTGAISSPQKIYDSNQFGSTYNFLLFGISAMAYDAEKQQLYVATTISNATTAVNYRIEKLSYDPAKIGVSNSNVLSKSNTVFYDYGHDTKCISDLTISE